MAEKKRGRAKRRGKRLFIWGTQTKMRCITSLCKHIIFCQSTNGIRNNGLCSNSKPNTGSWLLLKKKRQTYDVFPQGHTLGSFKILIYFQADAVFFLFCFLKIYTQVACNQTVTPSDLFDLSHINGVVCWSSRILLICLHVLFLENLW